MADWSQPTPASNYITFVDEVKLRDVDAITLQVTALTNPPTGSIRLLRSPVKFQEWNGTTFVDKILAPEGGGTGVTSISALLTQLNLGSMAYQNSPSVNITGGSLGAVTIINGTYGGSAVFNGTRFLMSSSTGEISCQVMSYPGNWGLSVDAPNTAGQSHGALITAGTGVQDNAFYVRNAAVNKIGLQVRGDMAVYCRIGLVIPVGSNAYVPA